MLPLARSALGGAAIPFRATLFEKSPRANWLVAWHQDTALPLASRFDADGWGPWSQKEGVLYAHAPEWALARVVAVRLHLDQSSIDNGPLRVVPGSHCAGLLTDQGVREYVTAHVPIPCPAPRGSALLMKPLLIHSSPKALDLRLRRVLHIEYAGSLDLAPRARLAVA